MFIATVAASTSIPTLTSNHTSISPSPTTDTTVFRGKHDLFWWVSSMDSLAALP